MKINKSKVFKKKGTKGNKSFQLDEKNVEKNKYRVLYLIYKQLYDSNGDLTEHLIKVVHMLHA